MSMITQFRIGPVTGPRSAVLTLGLRPPANTADLGPVTGPVRNHMINNIIVQGSVSTIIFISVTHVLSNIDCFSIV